jgi:hypothetical protein
MMKSDFLIYTTAFYEFAAYRVKTYFLTQKVGFYPD